MGRVETGTVQVSMTMHREPEPPKNRGEFTVSLLRILARKDVGEPLTGDEREAARLALSLFGHDWR